MQVGPSLNLEISRFARWGVISKTRNCRCINEHRTRRLLWQGRVFKKILYRVTMRPSCHVCSLMPMEDFFCKCSCKQGCGSDGFYSRFRFHRFRIRFRFHKNVVIILVAIPPTNAEAAGLADRSLLRFRIPGRKYNGDFQNASLLVKMLFLFHSFGPNNCN